MQELELIRQVYTEKKDRLGDTADRVERARRSLQIEVSKADLSNLRSIPESTVNGPKINGHISDAESADGKSDSGTARPLSPSSEYTETDNTSSLKDELDQLQKTHSDTLGDLAAVTAKYRDALREISDLAAQVTEVKLQLNQDQYSDTSSDVGLPGRAPRTPITPGRPQRRPSSRGATWADSSSPVSAGGRHPFFRSAASTESLHSR